MNARELVDHIHSGPAELVLNKALPRFRRRTRSNPCDFNEFLQALQSSETIRTVICSSQLRLSITEDEWVLLVKTLGSIQDIHHLEFYCTHGSRYFNPSQAVAEAVNNAHSLCELRIDLHRGTNPGDSSGLTALANALREHIALQEFIWIDHSSRMQAAQGVTSDVVLRALPACPRLRKVVIMTKCASAAAMQNLLQMQSTTDLRLVLETEQWLAVTDEMRHDRCNVQTLSLAMLKGESSKAIEAVKAVASAIRLDRNLKYLTLQMENGFTDEASVALAEALTVNKTLHKIKLCIKPVCTDNPLPNADELGVPAYEAFSAMMRVNTSLGLHLPPFGNGSTDERVVDSHNQMCLEQRLNQAGRGRLLTPSNHTTREEWVNTLYELSAVNVNEPSAFNFSCLYSLLRLNPTVCMLPVDAGHETYRGIFAAWKKFLNTGLLGAIIATIVAFIALQLVASAFPHTEWKSR
jgi:hypothetical protein